jgi:hypothetical protein
MSEFLHPFPTIIPESFFQVITHLRCSEAAFEHAAP